MRKLYICHEFGGKEENKKIVEDYIKKIVDKFDDVAPISPIHNTGFLYEHVSYEKGIEYCLSLLDTCDSMVTFGDESNSKGCLIEKEYCERNGIPVIDFNLLYYSE